MGGEEEVNNGVRGSVYGGGRGVALILYGNSEIKRGAPKNKGRFALQVEGRFALPLTERKIN
jgi:hypothetical protein